MSTKGFFHHTSWCCHGYLQCCRNVILDPMITSHRVSVMKDGYTNNTFVSLCPDEEFSSLRDEDGILSILLESSPNGDLDVPVGLPINQIFSWPYEGITRSHVDVLRCTFKGSETKRSCTEHFGLFQSMGICAYSRCSSSLCEHPDLKTQNQYWNWGMSSGLLPFASSIQNSLFRQAHNVSHTCGEIISRLTRQDPNFDYTCDRASLVTVNYATNASHRDNRYWMPTPCYVVISWWLLVELIGEYRGTVLSLTIFAGITNYPYPLPVAGYIWMNMKRCFKWDSSL